MKSAASKLSLIAIASLSAFAPCFADSIYDEPEVQPEVQGFPWLDIEAPAVQPVCPVLRHNMPRTSLRTNTNLSAHLPPTVTCSMKLSVVDDRDYTPVAAEPQIEINIISENASPARPVDRQREGVRPVSRRREGVRATRYSENF